MELHPELALLAPVPSVFLPEGRELCENRRKGKVAFGSQNFELFRKLDRLREGLPVCVLIYASHSGASRPSASWQGHYIGSVEPPDGLHPGGSKFRPATAVADGDNEGRWGVYWEIADLKPLDVAVPIAGLRGWEADKDYDSFVPEGPVIIERPL